MAALDGLAYAALGVFLLGLIALMGIFTAWAMLKLNNAIAVELTTIRLKRKDSAKRKLRRGY